MKHTSKVIQQFYISHLTVKQYVKAWLYPTSKVQDHSSRTMVFISKRMEILFTGYFSIY